MQRRSAVVVLVLSLAAGAVFAASATAAQVTPAQAGVQHLLDSLVAAEKRGDVAAMLDLVDPALRVWNLSEPKPLDKAGFKVMLEDFFRTSKLVAFEMPFVAIDVVADTGVAYVRYKETIHPASGPDVIAQGAWVATTIRRGGRWVFLSWSWLPDK